MLLILRLGELDISSRIDQVNQAQQPVKGKYGATASWHCMTIASLTAVVVDYGKPELGKHHYRE